MKVIRVIRVIKMIRIMRTIKARRKIKVIRKILSNILLLTINCNSTPCQALQYIKYYLVGTGSELQVGYWLVIELKFVTNQTIYSTGLSTG